MGEEYFLPGKAGEACGGIEGGHEKGGEGEGDKDHATLVGETEAGGEGGDTIGKEVDGALIAHGRGVVGEGEGGDGYDGDDGEDTFDEHAAVGYGADVVFAVYLFGGGAGGDEGVEAGAGAAGNGNKEEG